MLDKPQIVSVNKQNSTADTVSHTVYPVEQKPSASCSPSSSASRTGRRCWCLPVPARLRRAGGELNLDGIKSVVVHGDKAQGSRRRALREFTEGKLRVLVATEVAARGLDIPDLGTWSTMICRSWRKTMCTASVVPARRQSGMAISFVSREEERTLLEIEALIGQKIRRIMVPGYEVSSRDELIKQLQERRRFGKRPQRKTTPPPRPMAEAKLQGQRLKRLAAAKKPRQPK